MEGFSKNTFAALEQFGEDVSDSEFELAATSLLPSSNEKAEAPPAPKEAVPAKKNQSKKDLPGYGRVATKVWLPKEADGTNAQLAKGPRGAQQRPNGNSQNAAQNNGGRVYQQRPNGNNQNAAQNNGVRVYQQRPFRKDGYQQRNGAQEKEKAEKLIVGEDGWSTPVNTKRRGSDGDLSKSSSRPESRENRSEENVANVNDGNVVEVSKQSEEVSAPAPTSSDDMKDVKEVPASPAAVEEPLPEDPKERKKELSRRREEKRLKEEREKKEDEDRKQLEAESQYMTLEEYEKKLAEQKKALEALKAEERRVAMDKDFETMQVVGERKKEEDELAVDFFGRPVHASEKKKPVVKEVKVDNAEKDKKEKEKAEMLKSFYRNPPPRSDGGDFRKQGRRDGGDFRQQGRRDGGDFRQQGRRDGGDRQQGQRNGGDFLGQQGRREGRDFQGQQVRRDGGEQGRGESSGQRAYRGNEASNGNFSSRVQRAAKAPATEDFKEFPDLSAASQKAAEVPK